MEAARGDAVRLDTTTGNATNLLILWGKATEWEKQEGFYYYHTQRQNIAALSKRLEHGNPDLMSRIGAFASLSPNNDEAGNYRDLETCIIHHWSRLTVSTSSDYKPGKEDTYPACSTYPANVRKAMLILDGMPPDEALKGPKVTAFYHNTLDPIDPYWVCIDGHMVSAWLGRRVMLRRRSSTVEGEVPKESAEINRRAYETIADDLRAVARKLRVVPSGLQATLWLTWKRVNNIRYDPQLKIKW